MTRCPIMRRRADRYRRGAEFTDEVTDLDAGAPHRFRSGAVVRQLMPGNSKGRRPRASISSSEPVGQGRGHFPPHSRYLLALPLASDNRG
jgi:hypothetical protein